MNKDTALLANKFLKQIEKCQTEIQKISGYKWPIKMFSYGENGGNLEHIFFEDSYSQQIKYLMIKLKQEEIQKLETDLQKL